MPYAHCTRPTVLSVQRHRQPMYRTSPLLRSRQRSPCVTPSLPLPLMHLMPSLSLGFFTAFTAMKILTIWVRAPRCDRLAWLSEMFLTHDRCIAMNASSIARLAYGTVCCVLLAWFLTVERLSFVNVGRACDVRSKQRLLTMPSSPSSS